MDYLEGHSLAELIEGASFLEPRRAVNIFAQVASALAHAHRNGVIHRDLKPANIMLVEHDGVPDYVKIVDFGIAKIVRTDNDETSQLTETGQLFGSPLYMSPEQCSGKNLDGRSDIYSLGCVMYRTLTGQPPFQVRDLPDCIYKHVHEMPAPFEYACPDRSIASDVEAIAFKALAKSPIERYQTMGEMEESLRAWLIGKPLPEQTRSMDGTPVPTVSDTTTRIPAYKLPPPSAPDSVPQSVSITTSNERIPTLPPSQLEQTSDSSITVPAQQSDAATAETTRINFSHLIALVATSLLILLPISYFMVTHDRTPHTVKGPVDQKLITTAAQNAQKPDSAAKTVTTDESLQAGIEKFNQGRFDLALKTFSGIASNSTKSGNYEAMLWEALTENELFRYNDAKKRFQQYLKHTDGKGPNHARALNGLGFSCSNTGQFDEAQGYFDRARSITEKLTGKDKVVHAQNLRGMAELALNQRKYKQAQLQLEAALKINQELGAPELEIAYVENDLGQTYEYVKQYDKARTCYDTALTMRENKMKGNNPLVAYSLRCIASVDYQQKHPAEAETNLRKALSIIQQDLSDDTLTDLQRNKLTLDVYEINYSLGAMSNAERHYEQALPYFNTAMETRARLYGDTDPTVLQLRKSCEALSQRLRRR